MIIREETPRDIESIRQLNRAAFGRDLEAGLVDQLRVTRQIIMSRVALLDRRIVGHLVLGPALIQEDRREMMVASLALMAVLPDFQRRGIGSALVKDAIDSCRQDDWPAVIVVGHTEYYPRFGFSAQTVAHLQNHFASPAFMGLELVPGALTGTSGQVRYPKPFDAL